MEWVTSVVEWVTSIKIDKDFISFIGTILSIFIGAVWTGFCVFFSIYDQKVFRNLETRNQINNFVRSFKHFFLIGLLDILWSVVLWLLQECSYRWLILIGLIIYIILTFYFLYLSYSLINLILDVFKSVIKSKHSH